MAAARAGGRRIKYRGIEAKSRTRNYAVIHEILVFTLGVGIMDGDDEAPVITAINTLNSCIKDCVL